MKSGFTLIELLVVLVIISLVSAFVAPHIFAPFGNLNLKTAAQKIAGTLRYNRSRAVTEKVSRMAVFDLDAQAMRTFSAAAANASVKENGSKDEQPDMKYDLPEDVRIQNTFLGEDVFEKGAFSVVFYPNGSSSGGEVVLSGDSGKRFSIDIDSITGIVKLAEVERDR